MTIHHTRSTASWTKNNRPIKPIQDVATDIDTLWSDVCDFLVEIRKENGDQYPGSSMYDLVSGLPRYLQHEHGLSDKLMSKAFQIFAIHWIML